MQYFKGFIRLIKYLIAAVILIIIIRAWDSRSMPDLYPWHTSSIGEELLVVNE